MNLYIFSITGNPGYKFRYGVTYANNQNDALEQVMQSMSNETAEISADGFGFIYLEIGQFHSVDRFLYEHEPETVIFETQTALNQYMNYINRLARKYLKKTKRKTRHLRFLLFLSKLRNKRKSLRIWYLEKKLQFVNMEHENMN